MLSLIVVMSALIILSHLGINIAPLLAGAGVVGVAIGFGSQALVKDVITGLFILAEDQLAIGDIVDVGKDHAGRGRGDHRAHDPPARPRRHRPHDAVQRGHDRQEHDPRLRFCDRPGDDRL